MGRTRNSTKRLNIEIQIDMSEILFTETILIFFKMIVSSCTWSWYKMKLNKWLISYCVLLIK